MLCSNYHSSPTCQPLNKHECPIFKQQNTTCSIQIQIISVVKNSFRTKSSCPKTHLRIFFLALPKKHAQQICKLTEMNGADLALELACPRWGEFPVQHQFISIIEHFSEFSFNHNNFFSSVCSVQFGFTSVQQLVQQCIFPELPYRIN